VKLREEFRVAEQPESLWRFFEQPEAVARCMPGVESIQVVDDDNVHVRATQSIGPMSATFDAKVTVLERVPCERLRFRATGRSVRGAVGNVRAENSVLLEPDGDGTRVVVEGDVVLAGALGSVGQKVVAKQAGKVTAQFASNLQRALAGEQLAPLPTTGQRVGPGEVAAFPAPAAASDRWCKVAAGLSAASALLSLVAVLRRPREVR
jgi:uncharacterized protein